MAKIIFNGKEREITEKTVSYNHLVVMRTNAFPKKDIIWTITWKQGERAGTLTPKSPPIKVIEGMIINVIRTDNA